MDAFLALGLLHVLSGLIWAATVLVLGLILLASSRDDLAVPRALSEAALIHRRVLRGAILVTTVTGVALAWVGGFMGEAWAVLTAAIGAGSLVAGAKIIAPACERALVLPQEEALSQGRRALGLVGIDLGAQSAAIGLMILTPGWGGAAILGGLLACFALAVALVRATDEESLPA